MRALAGMMVPCDAMNFMRMVSYLAAAEMVMRSWTKDWTLPSMDMSMGESFIQSIEAATCVLVRSFSSKSGIADVMVMLTLTSVYVLLKQADVCSEQTCDSGL